MNAGDKIQDRYRLEEPLGEGGMAEVWRALDQRLERTVAIKVMAGPLAADPIFLVRFFSEAQSVARISHPNVVSVLDFGQHDDRPFLVMEHVGGGSVADLSGERLTVERAYELVRGAARGAGAAHELGIVHRDVKPGNILLTEDGTAKLADFGIAAATGGESLTGTGAAIGSPHYISPEQAAGAGATPRSDVYSLGIVLYELLTGRRPFEGDNVTAVAIAQVEQEPLPPSEHVPQLAPSVDALVLACLAKDPQQRPADGNALASALEWDEVPVAPAAGTMATPEAEATDEGVVEKVTRRGILVGLLVAGLLAILLAGSVLLSAGPDSPVPTAIAEDDATPSKKKDDKNGSRSPSPSEAAAPEVVAATPTPTRSPSPTPSPSNNEEKDKKKERDKSEDASTSPSPTTSPTPEPTPTSDEPSPSPTP